MCIRDRCEVVDLSEKTNLSEVAEKMFELVDEKIFYKPFTFLVQNLFVLLIQTYLLHCMTVSDSVNKEEIICNRVGSYIKFWLNIEEDREVVTTTPTLSKIINEKIQYETFKELQKLYSKNKIVFVKDFNRRLPFTSDRLENFMEKNLVCNTTNPNIINDLVILLREILIDEFPNHQNFMNEMVGFLFTRSAFKVDENNFPTNLDAMNFSVVVKFQPVLNNKSVLGLLKKIISLINSTPGKFIDTAIFSGWLRNEYTAEFMKIVLQINKQDKLCLLYTSRCV